DRKKPLVENTERRIRHGLKKYGQDPFYVLNYTPGVSKHITDSLGSITTIDHHGIVVPSFIIKGEHINASDNSYVKNILDPLPTQTTRQTHALVMPWIIEMNSSGEAKPANFPLSTITAGGVNHAMMHVPFIIENKGQSNSRGITDPLNTLTTNINHG